MGGAGGVLAAAPILRGDPAVRVTLVEPRERIGLGLAYSTPDRNHLLNVRAANMSAFPDDPNHFLSWPAAQGLPSQPDRFVSRGIYDRYLADLLSIWTSARPARFRRTHGIRTELGEGLKGIMAQFDDGSVQLANMPYSPRGIACLRHQSTVPSFRHGTRCPTFRRMPLS